MRCKRCTTDNGSHSWPRTPCCCFVLGIVDHKKEHSGVFSNNWGKKHFQVVLEMCWRPAVYTEILGCRYLLSTSKALGSVRPAQSSNSSSSIKRFASFQIVLINLKLGTMSKVGCFWPWLVGGIPTPLKNMKLSWDDDIPNIWKNKKCSKPPTSWMLWQQAHSSKSVWTLNMTIWWLDLRFFQQEHMPPTVAWCNYRRLAENTETRNQGISTINANINRVM